MQKDYQIEEKDFLTQLNNKKNLIEKVKEIQNFAELNKKARLKNALNVRGGISFLVYEVVIEKNSF